MKFLHLFHKEVEFGNIEGYDDIKDIVRRALDSYENYNLLSMCSTGQCKDTFPVRHPWHEKGWGVFRWLEYH